MAELQEKSTSSWSDVTFLESACEVLLEVQVTEGRTFQTISLTCMTMCTVMPAQCRRVLKYSYAFGYYMKDGREKRLFEHLQVCRCERDHQGA